MQSPVRAKSFSLSHRDLKQVHTVVEECAEMWDDALAWQRHLALAIESRVGGRVGLVLGLEPDVRSSRVLDVGLGGDGSSSLSARCADLTNQGSSVLPGISLLRAGLVQHGWFSATFSDLARTAEDKGSAFAARFLVPGRPAMR